MGRKLFFLLFIVLTSKLCLSQIVINSKGEADFSLKTIKIITTKKTVSFDNYYSSKVYDLIEQEIGKPTSYNTWEGPVKLKKRVQNKKYKTKNFDTNYKIVFDNTTTTIYYEDVPKKGLTKTIMLNLIDKIVTACS